MSEPTRIDGGDTRLLDVLTEWFLAQERGEEIDLAALCPGDEVLRARALAAIEEHAPTIASVTPPRAARAGAKALPPPFDRIDDFELLFPLGRGGMGVVYSARQLSLGREVALKLIDADRWTDERAMLRFRREAELAAAIEHPNVVPVYATGAEQGFAFLAMKRLSGPPLDRAELPLAPREVARIGVAIADALDAAHRCGVVHRDVKPANILMDGNVPVLVDFGLARAVDDATVTRAGTVPGTLAYLAPEVLAGAHVRPEPRMDVYAVGATLYELAAGRPVVDSDEPQRMVAKIMLEDPPPLRLPPGERDLGTVIAKALEKDLRHRFSSAGQLRDELRRYLAGEPLGVRPVSVVARMWRRCFRHPRTTAAAVAAVAVLGIAGGLAAVRGVQLDGEVRRGSARIESALSRGEIDEAVARLADLVALAPDDPRILHLAATVDADVALRTLLDEAIHATGAADAEVLQRGIAAVERPAVLERHPHRARLALALACWATDRVEDAKAHLAAVELGEAGSSPAAQALAELFDGQRRDVLGVEAGHPDDHVVAAAAMRAIPRSWSETARALAPATLASGAPRRRAHLLEAVLELDAGEPARARARLRDLVARAPQSRHVRRNLARAEMWAGDFARAKATLDAIPLHRWSIVERVLDLEIAHRAGDDAAFGSRLAAHRSTGADGPALRWAEAHHVLVATGDVPRVLAMLEQVERDTRQFWVRDGAAADAYELRVLGALRGHRPAAWDELVNEGIALLDSMRYRRARAKVARRLAQVAAARGEPAAAMRWFETSIEWAPMVVDARRHLVELLLQIRDLGRDPSRLNEPMARNAALRARDHLRILVPLCRPSGSLAPETATRVLVAALEVMRELEDWSGAETALRFLVERSGPGPEQANWQRQLAELQELQVRNYGR